MKNLFFLLFIFVFSSSLKAQMSLELQIADSACACLNAIDSAAISSNNSLKMQCLQEAIVKNQESINKQYETEKRKEEDEEKFGLRGSLMIKVQNILSETCPSYQLHEKKIQQPRGRR